MSEKPMQKFNRVSAVYVAAGIVICMAVAFTLYYNPEVTTENRLGTMTINTTVIAENKNSLVEPLINNPEQKFSEQEYLNIALAYYNVGQFQECINVNRKILSINPGSASAYNNICASYNSMSKWDSAIAACNMALRLQQDFTLAQNNLNWALKMKAESKQPR